MDKIERYLRAGSHLISAEAFRKNGDHLNAISECHLALGFEPMSFLAHHIIGLSHNSLGNESGDIEHFKKAHAAITRAIEVGTDDALGLAEAHFNRGCILTDDLKRHKEAIEDFDIAINLNPSYREEDVVYRAKKASLGIQVEVPRLEPKRPGAIPTSPPVNQEKGFFGSIWAFLTKWICPKCGNRSGVVTDEKRVSDVEQIWVNRWDNNNKKTIVVPIFVWEEVHTYTCEDCRHSWRERKEVRRDAT